MLPLFKAFSVLSLVRGYILIVALLVHKNFKYLHVITVLTGEIIILMYSDHAREKMIERGISTKEVEEALQRGAKQFQIPNKILYHYRYFVVVTKNINNSVFIITVKPRW